MKKIVLTTFLMFWGFSATAEDQPLSSFQPVLSGEMIELLQKASVEEGQMDFERKCSSCHDSKKTRTHGKGPGLWNLFGRKAGSVEGFKFSDAMKSSGHEWNWATLNYYLTRTDVAVPGLAMNFRGIRRDAARADLLVYLATLNDEPVNLPKK